MDSFERCKAIIMTERGARGRGALSAPRRCRRPAIEGQPFCEVHERQAELQKLYQQLLVHGWEHRVDYWLRDQQRRQAQR
jgi:hypothetical protein